MRKHLQLKHSALIAALASVYPLQVLANAGITQFSIGDVTVQRAASSSALASGSRVDSGDLITTGSTGRTQLRFSDGGMVSLQPNSQFKIARYADTGDGKQDSFLVDLARGGMRALTGLIGKRNRENYKVTTSTATIGIRGSGFSMGYNPDGTLSVTTELDAIEVCNQAGCVPLNLGESALVVNATTLPNRTNQRASWNPPNPRRLITARNDDVNQEGKTASIRIETGLALTSAGLDDDGGRDIRLYLEGAAAGNPSTDTILGYAAKGESGSSGDIGRNGEISVVNRTGSLATGDLMILGTWQDAQWSSSQYEGSQITLPKSAFVMGVPTPQTAFDSAAGKKARYDLLQGTAQASTVFSSHSLTAGILLPSSHVLVDFGSTQRNLDVQLDVSMQRTANEYAASNTSSSPVQYNYTGSTHTSGSGFQGELSLNGGEGYGYFKGFFGGPAAEKLGLSFEADTTDHGDIAGAGVFERGELISPPPNVAVAGVGIGAGTLAVYLNGTLTTTEGDITGYTASNEDTVSVTNLQTTSAAGQPGDTNFIAIGQWSGLNWNQAGVERSDSTGAFVMGTPTPSSSLPAMGSRARYDLSSATPVYSTGNYGSGSLESSSHLTIDFLGAGQFVDVALDVVMPGIRTYSPLITGNQSGNEGLVTVQGPTSYQLRGSASGTNSEFKGMLSVGATACSYGANCGTGQAVGFVAASSANQAGLSFSANTGTNSPHGVLYGAGIFNAGQSSSTPIYNPDSSDEFALASVSLQSGQGTPYSGETESGATVSLQGSFLTGYTESGSYPNGGAAPSYVHISTSAKSFAAVGAPTEDSFIGWGYWAQAQKTSSVYDGYGFTNSTSMVDHLHYLVGKPTPYDDMPTSGTANYSLLGGTQPTATLNGQTQTGQILPSSHLAVNFNSSYGQVTANIDTRFGATNASFSGQASINDSKIQSCGNTTIVNGFFTGAGGVRAGIVYQNSHGTLGTIQGAAAFQRTSGSLGFSRGD